MLVNAPAVPASAMRAAGPELTLLAGAVADGTQAVTVTVRAQVSGADVGVGTTTVLINGESGSGKSVTALAALGVIARD